MRLTDALDIAREAAWEVKAVNEAIKRYREAVLERDPHELPPGRRVLVTTVGPVSDVIRARQDALARAEGRPQPWVAPFLTFDPDVLAVISVATALRAREQDGAVGQTMPAFAKAVCAALRDQSDHDRFVREQKAEARANPETGGEQLRRFRRLFPAGDRRAWTRFASRVEGARTAAWPAVMRMQMGAELAHNLATGAPEWFEVAQAGTGPLTHRPLCLLLTSSAVEKLAEAEVRAEVARPLLLPMIIPPNPWRYVAKKETI